MALLVRYPPIVSQYGFKPRAVHVQNLEKIATPSPTTDTNVVINVVHRSRITCDQEPAFELMNCHPKDQLSCFSLGN